MSEYKAAYRKNVESTAVRVLRDCGVNFSIGQQRIYFDGNSQSTVFAFDVELEKENITFFVEEFTLALRKGGWLVVEPDDHPTFRLVELSLENKTITASSDGQTKLIVEYKFNGH